MTTIAKVDVPVTSRIQKTEAYELFSSVTPRLTTISVAWSNNTTSTYIFKVGCLVTGTASSGEQFSAEISLAPGASTSYLFTGLRHGTPHQVRLQRKELGAFVDQVVNATTNVAKTDVTTVAPTMRAYGTDSGILASLTVPDLTPNPTYKLGLVQGQVIPTATTQFIKIIDIPDTSITNVAGGSDYFDYKITDTTLIKTNTQYTVCFMCKAEGLPDTTPTVGLSGLTGYYVLGAYYTETVTAGQFSNIFPKASVCEISWSGDTTSSYRVVKVVTDPAGPIETTLITRTGAPATGVPEMISGLAPNSTYTIKLKRKIGTGFYNDEGTSTFVTASSTLTITGYAASSVALSWTKAYSGASYVISYKKNGTTDTPTKMAAITTDTVTAMVATVTGLKPATEYSFVLSVSEQGGTILVPLGRAILGADGDYSSADTSTLVTSSGHANWKTGVSIAGGVLFLILAVGAIVAWQKKHKK